MYRHFAERYGWTPEQTSSLTWPQLCMFLEQTEPYKIDENGRKVIEFTGPDAMEKYANWKRLRRNVIGI